MFLVRVAVANYRCFDQRQDIELCPVTVILGRNNSGKSALVRTLVVLNTGIQTSSPAPLDLDKLNGEMLESFNDLIYGNRPHGSISIELEFSNDADPPLRMAATVQHIDEYRTEVISSLEIQEGNSPVRLKWEPIDPPDEIGQYTIEAANLHIESVPVAFEGLLPTAVHGELPGELAFQLKTTAQKIRDSYPTVRYFGPFRDRPQRRYRLPARMPADVGVSGEYTAGILASDAARQQGRLIREINQKFSDSLPGWTVGVVERGGMYSVVLTSRDDPTLSVNLADAGTGVAQELPIFVQRVVDVLDPPSRPVLEIIEQPELHLHPAAHAALADLYLNAALRTNTRFLIETHSETLLLRLRRRIAEGSCPPETVAIYFIDHQDGAATARRIRVDADGQLNYWPTGVFSEDYEETRELAKAQLARGGAVAG